MIRKFLAGLVALGAVIWTMPAQAEMKVGVGMRVITPDPLLPVSGGVGTPHAVKEKRGELASRAMVFQNGDTTVAVVGLDLLGFPSVLGNRVRKQVTGIPAENILIASTHTHSAPDCYGFPDRNGGHTGNLEFMDAVCNKTAEAINEALKNLKPAVIKINTDEAKGQIAYNYYAPQLYDPRMTVIQASGTDGKVIGTLVNYAIHPEVLGNSVGICSPDLVGPLRDKIEAEAGGMALFMNGAQGGMITADNRDLTQPPRDPLAGYWKDFRTWEECIRIGNIMAAEALRIIKNAPLQKDAKLYCTSMDVKFPVDSNMMWGIIIGSPLKYPRNDDHTITARMNLVNLGDAQILTIPGEALPNIGYYLKRKMNGKHNLLFGLTNDAFGYILTKVDFNSFKRYQYVSQTSLGEMTGEILIEKGLELVDKSPEPDKAK